MTPNPGISACKKLKGRQVAGNSNNVLSIVDTMKLSTHNVMAKGTQINKPVMKYLRIMMRPEALSVLTYWLPRRVPA